MAGEVVDGGTDRCLGWLLAVIGVLGADDVPDKSRVWLRAPSRALLLLIADRLGAEHNWPVPLRRQSSRREAASNRAVAMIASQLAF